MLSLLACVVDVAIAPSIADDEGVTGDASVGSDDEATSSSPEDDDTADADATTDDDDANLEDDDTGDDDTTGRDDTTSDDEVADDDDAADDNGTADDDGAPFVPSPWDPADTVVRAEAIVGFPYRILVLQHSDDESYCALIELASPSMSPPTGVSVPADFGVTSMIAFGSADVCTSGEPPGATPFFPQAASGEIGWAGRSGAPDFCTLDIDVTLVFDEDADEFPDAIAIVAQDLVVDGCQVP